MLIRVLPAVGAGLVLLTGAHALEADAEHAPALLPDRVQETPSHLIVTREHGEFRLGFRSAVRNAGAGPLLISGHRPDRSADTMQADQVIDRVHAPSELRRGIGRLRFVVSPDHRHWHLLGFERFELTRAGGGPAVVRDRKTGFCLGDRYPGGGTYTSRCGLGQPALLGVSQGISPGFGDAYDANLEGQFVPLDGVPSGRYRLVHRVNAARHIAEQRFDNNASSVTLDLRWRAGVPRIRLVPDSARSK
jgi:hypothetical protein